MSVDPQTFKGALGRFASGVTVVTVHTSGEEGGDYGMTASAFCSVSLNPPLIQICVKKGNHTHGLLQSATGFGVSILSADQKELSNRYGGWGDKPQDHFDDLAGSEPLPRGEVSGAPLLPGAMAWLDCTRFAAHDAGDHTIFIGEVQGASLHGARDELRPLLYFAGKYRAAGEAL
ncbi:MAG: flavin reductase family protein [Myxococcota bacterium]|nr:flavin reductase family protein [Myxococcota bacterium]